MANQVAARLKGDDYQYLYAWQFVLELKMPRWKVRLVTIEDALAGSVDDVTVQHEPGSEMADCFYQVKYHVDQRNAYSIQELTNHRPNARSLLMKLWHIPSDLVVRRFNAAPIT
ncbi:dsDNA nuclease domain-containing protein, partial [Candidatus Entotheonella palauensis]|uniref:dsDNA nuclease domain-containing protein n=1 Tax=Candidatus Entotheonella palauensis TaxID=93172 RepID=UPI0030B95145